MMPHCTPYLAKSVQAWVEMVLRWSRRTVRGSTCCTRTMWDIARKANDLSHLPQYKRGPQIKRPTHGEIESEGPGDQRPIDVWGGITDIEG